MMVTHPLHLIPTNRRRWVFVTLFITTILVMMIMNSSGRLLTTSAAPNGIISYELAGNAERAQDILDAWTGRAKTYAAFNLGLDYLFLILYSTSIGAGVLWLTDTLTTNHKILRLAHLLAWSLLVAAFLDAIENGALFSMLVNGARESWSRVALVAAVIKFAIVFVGLLYLLAGVFIRLMRRVR